MLHNSIWGAWSFIWWR